jgi:hypothetical protein
MAEKIRVQFDFTPSALEELDKLQGTMGAKSRAEVIRYALRVLQWLLDQLRSGGKIMVEGRDGKVQTVMFTSLPQSVADAAPPAEPAAAAARVATAAVAR